MFDFSYFARPRPGQQQEGDDAGTTTEKVQEGLDSLARQAAKVLTGINPDIKGHGVIPQDTDVGAGFSLKAATLLKDLPGGMLAGLLKHFVRELPQGLDVPLAILGELSPMETPGMDRGQELAV